MSKNSLDILFIVMAFLQVAQFILMGIVFDKITAFKRSMLIELDGIETRIKTRINAFLSVFRRAKDK